MSAKGGLRQGMDRLVVSGRRVFGWGWAAHPEHAVKSVHLRVAGEAWERRLAGGGGLSPHDVEEANPELVNTGSSAFLVTGLGPGRAADVRLRTRPPRRPPPPTLRTARTATPRPRDHTPHP